MICDLHKGLSKIASPGVLHFFDPWVLAEEEFPRQDDLEVLERTIVGNIFIDTCYLNIRAIVDSHYFTHRDLLLRNTTLQQTAGRAGHPGELRGRAAHPGRPPRRRLGHPGGLRGRLGHPGGADRVGAGGGASRSAPGGSTPRPAGCSAWASSSATGRGSTSGGRRRQRPRVKSTGPTSSTRRGVSTGCTACATG